MSIDLNKNKPAPAQLGFVATITFCGSSRADRITKIMDFATMVDWAKSAAEYFTQMVEAGDFDGSEVFVDIYEYLGGDPLDCTEWPNIVDQFVIDNTL